MFVYDRVKKAYLREHRRLAPMMMLVDSTTVRSLRRALGEARVRAVERELQAALVLTPPGRHCVCRGAPVVLQQAVL
tara:strand:+ start:480 stop:710 length:231 start_codon:yes stop_codon:yes gene_type:complete